MYSCRVMFYGPCAAVALAAGAANAALCGVAVGLGRIVTLYQRSPTLHRNRYHIRYLYF
jgi:hypothetical protein